MKRVNKKEYTVKFKGREARGLFWKKSIYEQWFEYAKISSEGYPEEFGKLDEFDNFEDWWRHPDYGFELFCEPAEKVPLEVVKEITETKEVGYLKIDLCANPNRIKLMFDTYLKKNAITKTIVSKARFQPSKEQKDIQVKSLQKYLECYKKCKIEGKSRKDVLFERNPNLTGFGEEDLRSISREIQKVKQSFKNIKNGTFP
jgi:hypothetical protein